MSAHVVLIDPSHPRDERLLPALRCLREGGLVAMPTETFYGLAADSSDFEALERVNTLKGKPADSPCLLLISSVEQASSVARDLPPLFDTMARRFWPGPLTLVVPARAGLPAILAGKLERVALRVPGLSLPRRLAEALGRPITGVSANRYREPPCRTAADVARVFPDGLAAILDGGPTPGGQSSTIIDLCEDPPRVLREGAIPVAALRHLFPELGPLSRSLH